MLHNWESGGKEGANTRAGGVGGWGGMGMLATRPTKK